MTKDELIKVRDALQEVLFNRGNRRHIHAALAILDAALDDAKCEWTHDGFGSIETECGSGIEIAGDGTFEPKFCFNCGRPARLREDEDGTA